MPNVTENYGLKKPLPEEFYDIQVQNENMDVIDAKLKELDGVNASAKTTLVDADTIPLHDSASSNALKKITWANIKTVLSSLFAAKSHTHTKSQISDFPSSIAPSTHASSHKTGGADAITPDDIGAVKKSGDTMTSTLTLPQLVIDHSILKGYITPEGASPKLQIIAFDKSTSRDGMLIVSPDGLFFLGMDGYEYSVYHQGNAPAAIARAELI